MAPAAHKIPVTFSLVRMRTKSGSQEFRPTVPPCMLMFVCVCESVFFIATSFAASNLILFCLFLLGPFRFFFTSLGHKRNAKQKKKTAKRRSTSSREGKTQWALKRNKFSLLLCCLLLLSLFQYLLCLVAFLFRLVVVYCGLLCFYFSLPFYLYFVFLHKPNVSQTLIGFYFYLFYSQLGEEFWAATNCDKGKATVGKLVFLRNSI